jgi:hypothetical protein
MTWEDPEERAKFLKPTGVKEKSQYVKNRLRTIIPKKTSVKDNGPKLPTPRMGPEDYDRHV